VDSYPVPGSFFENITAVDGECGQQAVAAGSSAERRRRRSWTWSLRCDDDERIP
jgi:hypothetical protein